MMTCRLLCALLVLALCCCPSVCVTGSEVATGKSVKDSVPTKSKPDEQKQVTGPPSTTPSPPKNNDEGRGTEQSHTTGTITKTPQSQNTSNITQDQDGGKSNEQTEHTNAVTANEQKKAAAPTTTTTSTTQAPTTTTTTQAPINKATTTEAPTTTTTRTPSRLREIDGSLSSSAWVCAPLLLAVSALAYTTLG
ncbi:mucin TcMUCII, putative [Trypanosoma cruzi]|uniref:Mucin TcMUCII, putative n=1 Tax=Trypanosoma cruzi (strain CL Brener) TaxID=353153 RepID=Q4DEM9_TRYCC|nr:mucin TcMUCII, putative [Trypanosoma cruzi]EAN90983.1 mucin TcMUCII, putative [Trypanosoma cruzi]|eukprot:XP_812834.1 mucin TcMUCII [Trypanosoma cruzi strain CL Brener]